MILTITVTGTAASVSAAGRDAVVNPAATPPGWHAASPVLAPAPRRHST